MDVKRDYCDITLVNGGGDVNAKIFMRITTTLLMMTTVFGLHTHPAVCSCWRGSVGSVSMSNKLLLKSSWLIDSVLGALSSTDTVAWQTSVGSSQINSNDDIFTKGRPISCSGLTNQKLL